MTEEPTDRVEAVFDGAADLTGTEREAYLEAACGGDRALRAEVEELLAHDKRSMADKPARGFLQSPVDRAAGKTSLVGGQSAPAENRPPAIPGYEIEGVLGR